MESSLLRENHLSFSLLSVSLTFNLTSQPLQSNTKPTSIHIHLYTYIKPTFFFLCFLCPTRFNGGFTFVFIQSGFQISNPNTVSVPVPYANTHVISVHLRVPRHLLPLPRLLLCFQKVAENRAQAADLRRPFRAQTFIVPNSGQDPSGP